MELDGFIPILVGSTFGLTVRMFLKDLSRRSKVFFFNYVLLANVSASLLLGIFISLNITNKNLILFFSVGFLGCLSTFSSFIYQLFSLIRKRKYLILLLNYVEVLVFSFLLFCFGYFITLLFKS